MVWPMFMSKSSPVEIVTDEEVARFLQEACDALEVDGRRVLVIVPDGTRTCPLPLLFRLLYANLGRRVQHLDYLIALGTHQPMSAEAMGRLLGTRVAQDGSAENYPGVRVFNHRWSDPATLHTIGVISRAEAAELTDGLLADEIAVTLNRMIFEYDRLLICGPVFPQ